MIYRLIYLILHCVYTLFQISTSVYSNLKTKFIRIFGGFTPRDSLKLPNTIPKHLTVLLGNETPSKNDLVNLIVWCLAARIPFISFYDYRGLLKNEENEIRSLLDKKLSKTDHVIWHNQSQFTYKNGYTGRKIHVKVLDRNDGKASIVNTIKQLVLSETFDKNCNLDGFDEMLCKRYEFPDPDVGLCFGKTFSLYGYPPWPISVTEFFQIEQIQNNFTINQFIHLLEEFSKCEQRYGK